MIVLTLDPNKDFVITDKVNYATELDGSQAYGVTSVRHIDYRLISGIWIPEKAEERYFRQPEAFPDLATPSRIFRIQLHNVIVNPTIPDDDFEFENLGFPLETTRIFINSGTP